MNSKIETYKRLIAEAGEFDRELHARYSVAQFDAGEVPQSSLNLLAAKYKAAQNVYESMTIAEQLRAEPFDI